MAEKETPKVGIVAENASIITMLENVVRTITPIVPGTAEVVLHEIAKLPESIVAVAGNVTGRAVGDPATDVLLETVASGSSRDFLQGYSTVLPDGRQLTSSTTIFRNSRGEPVAALCVNSDLGAWERLRDLVSEMSGFPLVPATAETLGTGSNERFAHDVEELADHLIADTIARAGVPVDLMKKEHKLAVVARLRERGMFLLRDAVETVAGALEVTRFTIYNYLNELEGAPGNEHGDADGPSGS
ncbi:PAS domain-containing protein [Salinibacterium sp. NG253]|uniref:helix-turn-helix transcriptional regulator n=1 Tax=unclassified Salinibacterium TaxID=2632331 RepID=UPI0018CCCCDB|nr:MULTISPECIES: PAS domain-containing protein [unclassified Salinibacterium]MBH0110547.1 PAS domain-containing protein [Salinibacterium sp. NG22]MBH0117651.1 PAS domain-containing protein [Salinibacterium sp. NG253]